MGKRMTKEGKTLTDIAGEGRKGRAKERGNRKIVPPQPP